MFSNYLKIAIRNILRNKTFSGINIIGLSISIAVSFCIVVYVSYELSYDKHNPNYNNIYRVDSQWKEADLLLPMTSFPLGIALKEEIPDIDEVVRCFYESSLNFQLKNSSYTIKNNYFADPSIFDVFNYEIEEGNKDKFFEKPNSVVLSERAVLTIFGKNDVIGELISFQFDKVNVEVEITGVIKNENHPATIIPEAIFPLELLLQINKYYEKDDWVQLQRVVTFLLISDDVNIDLMEQKIRLVNDSHTSSIPNYIMDVDFILIPLRESYFINEESYGYNFMPVINLDELITYSAIAFLIVLLACINFILLTTARSSIRYLEFGIRKVVGALKRDVILQIIFESIITLLLTVPFTLLFIELIFPYLQDIVNSNIYPPFYYNLQYVFSLIFIILMIGILTGWYIASSLFRKQSAEIFTQKNNSLHSVFSTRRILLFFQIVVFVGLLVSSLILKKQMVFMYNYDPGYDNSNVIKIYCEEIKGLEESFKNSVIQYSAIKDYSFTSNSFPLERGTRHGFSSSKNRDELINMASPFVGNDYPRFLNMKLIAGIYPDKNNKGRKVVINETAAKVLDYDDPIGNYVWLFGKYKREIVGVVEDFHINSMREKIMPVVMELDNRRNSLMLRIENGREIETLKLIQKKWSVLSNFPMDYEFTTDKLKYIYAAETNFEKLINLYTALAVLISTMGLFGLVMFSINQRTKEIGIRKVLGASIFDILKLISKEFIILIVTGSMIAFPTSYYFMSNWLNSFAYKIHITADIFFLAVMLTLLISLLTIGTQVIKATKLNPVNSLRNE